MFCNRAPIYSTLQLNDLVLKNKQNESCRKVYISIEKLKELQFLVLHTKKHRYLKTFLLSSTTFYILYYHLNINNLILAADRYITILLTVIHFFCPCDRFNFSMFKTKPGPNIYLWLSLAAATVKCINWTLISDCRCFASPVCISWVLQKNKNLSALTVSALLDSPYLCEFSQAA